MWKTVKLGQSMFDRSNFGTKLWTTEPNVKYGTKFGWNVNFGTMQKDYVCRSLWLVPKLICAEVSEIFKNLCRISCAEVHPCQSSFTRFNLNSFACKIGIFIQIYKILFTAWIVYVFTVHHSLQRSFLSAIYIAAKYKKTYLDI